MGIIVKSNKLPNFASELQKKVDREVADIANKVAETARQHAPVRTGKLRDSIYVEDLGAGEYEIQANAEYATFVEYGTARSAAQPFMRPAYEKHIGEVNNLMMRAIRGALD